MVNSRLKLGELLLKEGLITQEQLNKALEVQKKDRAVSLGALLVGSGVVSEQNLAMALSRQLNVSFVSKKEGTLTPDRNLAGLIPEEFARANCILPLSLDVHNLKVAVVDPMDIVLLDNLYKMTGFHITPAIGVKSDIEEAISLFYGEGGMLKQVIEASLAAQDSSEPTQQEDRVSLDDLVASAEREPVVKLTDLLIRQAIKQRASDIHIEPNYDSMCIRFRIDGVLQEVPHPDKSMLLPLISRIKILSKMDIAEKRLPQDGSFRATIEGRMIDFRVSTIPTAHGEKAVLRILDRSAVSLDLDSMGFSPTDLLVFKKAINKPYGMILITGPTGSGKTTTLYSALTNIKSMDKNITTIEDPIEYQIKGINQVQVKPGIGLTFASGLRSFLRQDPDVILVGETRDHETAQICVRAALTGHLVFTTLHTNDAASAVSRLMDIGIEPFFVSSSLLLVLAQRLIRRLCPKCKEAYKPLALDLPDKWRWGGDMVNQLYKANGCEACSFTGYKGRMAIYEIMPINEAIESLILKRASVTDIRAAAKKTGMLTLEENGFKKVAEGETSLEEVMRVVLSNY